MSDTDISKMKVADLKRELKLRGLTTTGNKTELQDRLQTALIDGDLSLDTGIPGEELLDEDPVLTDDEEKILGSDENELLKSPTPTSAAAADLSASVQSNSATTTSKKIVLKRKNSFTINNITSPKEAASETGTKENTEPSPAKAIKMSERNPITIGNGANGGSNEDKDKTSNASGATAKVSQLTIQERLELRAKKFGINSNATSATATADVKDKANGNASSGVAVNNDKQMEMLKKRAERFGCVVSSKIAKLEAAEKLQKRKERFGVTGSSSATTAESTADSSVWAEKARQRLERFKMAPTAVVPVKSTSSAVGGN